MKSKPATKKRAMDNCKLRAKHCALRMPQCIDWSEARLQKCRGLKNCVTQNLINRGKCIQEQDHKIKALLYVIRVRNGEISDLQATIERISQLPERWFGFEETAVVDADRMDGYRCGDELQQELEK